VPPRASRRAGCGALRRRSRVDVAVTGYQRLAVGRRDDRGRAGRAPAPAALLGDRSGDAALRGAYDDDDLGDVAFLRVPVVGERALQPLVGALGLCLACDLDVGGEHIAEEHGDRRQGGDHCDEPGCDDAPRVPAAPPGSRSVMGLTGLA